MRDERLKMEESKCRNTTVEENLKIFNAMNTGPTEEIPNCDDYCLRGKVNM